MKCQIPNRNKQQQEKGGLPHQKNVNLISQWSRKQ